MTVNELAITIVSSAIGGGGFTAFITALFNRRKKNTDAASVVVAAAINMLAQYRAEVDRLTVRVDALEKENADLRKEVERLGGESII